MITPGFFNFFNAHRGLIAAQNALSTANHNITNANTEGYSRQRVDLATFESYAPPSKYMLNDHSIGQGPIVQQVTRSRDQFLDIQYRDANGLLGFNTTIRDALQQVEGILSEPSTNGINTAMQNFFDAAQEMSLHPESLAVRADFIQQANDLLNVFQQQGLQLLDLRRNIIGDPQVAGSVDTSQMAVVAAEANNHIENIVALNKSIIATMAGSGSMPNDLLDQRDLLLDKLSQLVDIEVTQLENGQVNVDIGGMTFIRGAVQLEMLKVIDNPGIPGFTPDALPALIVAENLATAVQVPLNNDDPSTGELTSGKLRALSDMGGSDPTLSTIRNVMGNLDTLFQSIQDEMFTLQTTGTDYYGNPGANLIFSFDPALNPGQPLNLFHWRINNTLIFDPRLVAAGQGGGVGDGSNALNMAQVRDQDLPALGTTVGDYFNNIISKLGIDTRSYENTSGVQQNVINTADERRQSISGVSVDEEMIDVLRFQRAFEATSKVIQTIDEVMETIINMV